MDLLQLIVVVFTISSVGIAVVKLLKQDLLELKEDLRKQATKLDDMTTKVNAHQNTLEALRRAIGQ